MLSAEESAELRALQIKAYGSDGALSTDESARLRELEQRHHAGQGDPQSAGDVPDPSPDSGAADTGERRERPGQRVRPAQRVRVWLAVVGVVIIFALGVGFGWMLFGRSNGSSIALDQEQRARALALVTDGEYDADSLRALLARDGIVVWLATTDAGESLCLIVDDGSATTTACSDEDRVASDGLVVEHRIVDDGHTDIAYATLLLTGERDPAVHLDVQRDDG